MYNTLKLFDEDVDPSADCFGATTGGFLITVFVSRLSERVLLGTGTDISVVSRLSRPAAYRNATYKNDKESQKSCVQIKNTSLPIYRELFYPLMI